MNFKQTIIDVLAQHLEGEAQNNPQLKDHLPSIIEQLPSLLEKPPKNVHADWAFPCFILAKHYRDAPVNIAKALAEEIDNQEFPGTITAAGPYLNFLLKLEKKAEEILTKIWDLKADYGKPLSTEDPRSIVIEFPSPNTNKPLHLGHLRNMLLGQLITKLHQFVGNEAHPVNLCNDRGIHICKSMLAYQKFGEEKTPESENVKSDHFVGKYYVKYAQAEEKTPEIQEEAYDMLRKWEANDPEVRALWEKMNQWALDGFQETFDLFGIQHKTTYFESEMYKHGKEIVAKGVEKGVFFEGEEGEIRVRFEDYKTLGLPETKVVLRSDKTALYITQDLYLAYKKMEDFDYDQSLYVIGNEQDMQMRTLFTILDLLGFKGTNIHISHGMIDLPSGKMKSREGKVVDVDVLFEEVKELASKEIQEKHPGLAADEIDSRSFQIAMAAIRFFVLKFDYKANFTFLPEESIEFQGETGPYIQYTYVRTQSIFEKAGFNPKEFTLEKNIDWNLYKTHEEEDLIDLLFQFPEIIRDCVESYRLHHLPKYLFDLAQSYNKFYANCQVIQENKDLEHARLFLIACFAQVIKNGLNLLDIETPAQM